MLQKKCHEACHFLKFTKLTFFHARKYGIYNNLNLWTVFCCTFWRNSLWITKNNLGNKKKNPWAMIYHFTLQELCKYHACQIKSPKESTKSQFWWNLSECAICSLDLQYIFCSVLLRQSLLGMAIKDPSKGKVVWFLKQWTQTLL